jgi:hypothetical protein
MPALTQMKLLVNLAKVDGQFTEREKNYIINIGRANGIYPDELRPLFEMEHEVLIPEGLSPDQKFDCIYNLVQLMKIDERMYQEEIKFCSMIATNLGYEQQALFELMLQVKSTEITANEREALKKLTSEMLKKPK